MEWTMIDPTTGFDSSFHWPDNCCLCDACLGIETYHCSGCGAGIQDGYLCTRCATTPRADRVMEPGQAQASNSTETRKGANE